VYRWVQSQQDAFALRHMNLIGRESRRSRLVAYRGHRIGQQEGY
jgi:hypothetical protein